MYKILMVEDDDVIVKIVSEKLNSLGYQCKAVDDLNNVMAEFIAYEPALVLIDITLPFQNGYYWCSKIRETSQVPIIFLTSKNENMDVITAINMGADDFVSKPFDMEVLLVKIQGLIRRTYEFVDNTKIIESRGAILNLNDATISYEGNTVELTNNEFKILSKLFMNKGAYVYREEIMMKLWDSDIYIDDNTLTVNITRLRKKLETIGLMDLIKTKKGIGYMIE